MSARIDANTNRALLQGRISSLPPEQRRMILVADADRPEPRDKELHNVVACVRFGGLERLDGPVGGMPLGRCNVLQGGDGGNIVRVVRCRPLWNNMETAGEK